MRGESPEDLCCTMHAEASTRNAKHLHPLEDFDSFGHKGLFKVAMPELAVVVCAKTEHAVRSHHQSVGKPVCATSSNLSSSQATKRFYDCRTGPVDSIPMSQLTSLVATKSVHLASAIYQYRMLVATRYFCYPNDERDDLWQRARCLTLNSELTVSRSTPSP
eukprot:TRINITY_DN2404_c0_g1_i1.p4 TRINITY_DN2404_c0_g1~~TRINITY_DN2404_c0_g1_i1.p4  ORF type:complete len:162 (+),score=10.82 TRINITY_DN2404_c0_g1_i1:915-1400(+)